MLFIINGKAGKGNIKTKVFDLVDTFQKSGYEVTLHITQKPKDASEVAETRLNGFDSVVCTGGDGTLNEVVGGMMRSENLLPLGYLPTGTMNDFASNLGLSRNPVQCAEAVVKGDSILCDVGRFNRDYFVYTAACGAFIDVPYKTPQRTKNIMGRVAYLLEGVKQLYTLHPYHLRLESETATIEGDYIFGMVSNSRTVGGIKGLGGDDILLDDGLFEGRFIKMPKNPFELQHIVNSILTQEPDEEFITTFHLSKAVIHCADELPWTLDGEYGGEHKEVAIENIPRALQLYCDLSGEPDAPVLIDELE